MRSESRSKIKLTYYIPPGTGHESSIVQSKADRCLNFHRFSPFNFVQLSFCSLIKVHNPENSLLVFCPSKQRSFEPFMYLNLVLLFVLNIVYVGLIRYLQCIRFSSTDKGMQSRNFTPEHIMTVSCS